MTVPRGKPLTDDERAILEKLWAQGLSASQIAHQLPGRSRNSVIGHVHRLGLPNRISASIRKARRRNAQRKAAKDTNDVIRLSPKPTRPVLSASVPILKALVVEMKRTVAIEEPPELGEGINIFDLEPHHCRYIISQTGLDARFCGAQKAVKSYCKTHSRICHVMAKEYSKRPRPERVAAFEEEAA
jgi:GcrA cell cycle regulator